MTEKLVPDNIAPFLTRLMEAGGSITAKALTVTVHSELLEDTETKARLDAAWEEIVRRESLKAEADFLSPVIVEAG